MGPAGASGVVRLVGEWTQYLGEPIGAPTIHCQSSPHVAGVGEMAIVSTYVNVMEVAFPGGSAGLSQSPAWTVDGAAPTTNGGGWFHVPVLAPPAILYESSASAWTGPLKPGATYVFGVQINAEAGTTAGFMCRVYALVFKPAVAP